MRFQLKCACYLAQRKNGYIPFATLDASNIRSMQTGAMTKLVLRQTEGSTPLADHERKSLQHALLRFVPHRSSL
jgi:hypothetical protein